MAVRLAAVYANGLGFGDVTLPMPLAAAHTTNPLDSLFLIKSAFRADPRLVQSSLVQHLRARYAGIASLPRDGFEAQQRHLLQLSAWLNYLVLAVIFLFTAIAVANTLVMATAERSREFALLRLVGATRRQVLRMMRWEALVVAVIGTVIGTAVAAGALVVVSLSLTHSPVPAAPPLFYGAILAACLVLALAATLVPTRLALRLPPAETIGGDD